MPGCALQTLLVYSLSQLCEAVKSSSRRTLALAEDPGGPEVEADRWLSHCWRLPCQLRGLGHPDPWSSSWRPGG